MCRLVGWVSRTPRTARQVLGDDGLEALRRLSRLHADGWGMAVDGDPGLAVEHSTARADQDPLFATATADRATRAGIVHLRWATPGLPVQLSNTHPFAVGDRAFAHNGAIDPVERLGELLDPAWRSRLQGTTDSEHYFLAVLAELELPGTDVPTAVDRVTARVVEELDPSSLNALLQTPEALYAVNCHDPGAGPGASPPVEGSLGEARLAQEEPYFDLRYRVTSDSVVVASSGLVPTDDEAWRLLPNDHVLVVRRDTLAVEQVPLRAQLGRRSAAA